MACRLFGAKPLCEPILTNCQSDPKKKIQWNFDFNSNIFINENVFKNVVHEMAAIWSLPTFKHEKEELAGVTGKLAVLAHFLPASELRMALNAYVFKKV